MIDFKALSKPFPPEDVEWRIQQSGVKNDKVWAMCLAYITNRAIMDRLDEVCGPENWQNEFKAGPQGGVICGISIRVLRDNGETEWITKWDGSDETDIEKIKGGLSSAMKRAGVQFGIGRYLYDLEAFWAKIDDRGRFQAKTKEGKWFKWNPPELPAWALPGNHVQKAPPPATQQQPPASSTAASEGASPVLAGANITSEQAAELRELVKLTGMNESIFLKTFGATSFEMFSIAKFQAACAMCAKARIRK